MASKLNPYLGFRGNCREAMTFYASIFGGTPEFMTFADMGETGDTKDQVMHSSLITDAGYTLFASDTPPGMELRGNGQISVSGDDSDQLRGYWDALSDGANVEVPLARQPWGDDYGHLVDKFDILWMVNIAGEGNQG
jgi:PhnB protein